MSKENEVFHDSNNVFADLGLSDAEDMLLEGREPGGRHGGKGTGEGGDGDGRRFFSQGIPGQEPDPERQPAGHGGRHQGENG